MPCPEKFTESLARFAIDPVISERILDGFHDLVSSSPKARKAAFFSRATAIVDDCLEWEKKCELMEYNACCKGGQRATAIKKFAKDHSSTDLAGKIIALADVPNMGCPRLHADGTITAHLMYMVDGAYRCPCPNFHLLKMAVPVSPTYCLCCAGHFKHHYQNALGVRLKTKEIVSSPLSSMGRQPCVIAFVQDMAAPSER